MAGVGDASLESWMTIGLWESFISSFGKVALVVFRVLFFAPQFVVSESSLWAVLFV